MKDTSIGLRADLRDRKVVPDFLDTRAPMQHLGHSNLGENGAHPGHLGLFLFERAVFAQVTVAEVLHGRPGVEEVGDDFAIAQIRP